MRDALENIGSLAERLGDIAWWAVAIAVVALIARHALGATAWARLIRAAARGTPVSTPGVILAAGAGTAVNSFLPARMGEPVRLWVAGRAAPGAPRGTITTTFLTILSADIIIGVGVIALGGAFGLGEPLALLLERYLGPTGLLIAVVVIAGAAVAAFVAGRRSGRLDQLWRQLRAGLEPLESVGFYLTRVLSLQLGALVMRALAAAFVLVAIGIPLTPLSVAVVVVAQTAATAVPFQPGGFLLKLGVFLVAFADLAGPTEIVAFAVLYELTLYLTNVLFGVASLAVVFRGLSWRETVARVRQIGNRRPRDPEASPPAMERV